MASNVGALGPPPPAPEYNMSKLTTDERPSLYLRWAEGVLQQRWDVRQSNWRMQIVNERHEWREVPTWNKLKLPKG